MKALSLPSYPSPYGPRAIVGAYAIIAGFSIDATANSGRVTLNVYEDAAAAAAGFPPVGQVGFELGADKGLPALAGLIADNQAAWDSIAAYLLDRIAALPAFAGAAEV